MITKSLEDYIEFIYTVRNNEEQIKAVDIAKHFNISRASVSEALIRLKDKGLINYENKSIFITKEGELEAQKVLNKHRILSNFLSDVLGIDVETASDNACKIEHVIDDEIVLKLASFIQFCNENSIGIEFSKLNNDGE